MNERSVLQGNRRDTHSSDNLRGVVLRGCGFWCRCSVVVGSGDKCEASLARQAAGRLGIAGASRTSRVAVAANVLNLRFHYGTSLPLPGRIRRRRGGGDGCSVVVGREEDVVQRVKVTVSKSGALAKQLLAFQCRLSLGEQIAALGTLVRVAGPVEQEPVCVAFWNETGRRRTEGAFN